MKLPALRNALARYLRENLSDLLALDLKVARLLGIPAPYTLSAYAYTKHGFWERFINVLFKWLRSEDNHCYRDYLRVTQKDNNN